MNFNDAVKEVRGLIVRRAAYEQRLDDQSPINLALVCKKWQPLIEDEMTVGKPSWKACYGVTPENEDIYQQFLNGVLTYKPDPQSDKGMIQFKISSLIKLLEGTFYLSGCGDTSKYLSIWTSYRKGMTSENKYKL